MINIEKIETSNYDMNLNNEIIKSKIRTEINVLGKKIIICNYILNIIELELNYINSLSSKRKLRNIIQERKKIIELKLNKIIKNIVTSENLKDVFEIKRKIKNQEINLLLNDIEDSLKFLNFPKNDDISNFILAYIKKFLEFKD